MFGAGVDLNLSTRCCFLRSIVCFEQLHRNFLRVQQRIDTIVFISFEPERISSIDNPGSGPHSTKCAATEIAVGIQSIFDS